MAMPGSGSIGICTCPQGSCSSISTAVGIGSGSLCANADYVGLSRCMTAFYGYAPTTTTTTSAPSMHCIYGVLQSDSCISSCQCSCWRYTSNPTMGGSDCFNITLSWFLVKGSTGAPASQYMCIFCNGGTKATCTIGGNGALNCSGTLSSFTWCAGDLVEIIVKAEVYNPGTESSYADVYISNIACISGKGSFGLKPDSTGPRSFGMFGDIANGTNSGQKIDYVFMDSPYVLSPMNSKNLSVRATKDHMDRIRTTVEFYKSKTNKPIWLLGHSNGAYSLAQFINQTPNYDKLIGGAIFSSGRSEREITIDPINLPILVLHHADDTCSSTQFGPAQSFYESVKSKNRSRTEFVALTGGTNDGDPCSAPGSHHMYGGSYEQFTNAVQQFIFK